MGSVAGRHVQPWRTSAKLYFKCLAAALHDEGLRGSALLEAFGSMIPNWKRLFDGDISDDAPLQRADKARRYETEMPENHPAMKKMWPQAKRDAKARKKWTLAELRSEYPDRKPEKMAA